MNNLPKSILYKIFDYLNVQSLLQFKQTCVKYSHTKYIVAIARLTDNIMIDNSSDVRILCVFANYLTDYSAFYNLKTLHIWHHYKYVKQLPMSIKNMHIDGCYTGINVLKINLDKLEIGVSLSPNPIILPNAKHMTIGPGLYDLRQSNAMIINTSQYFSTNASDDNCNIVIIQHSDTFNLMSYQIELNTTCIMVNKVVYVDNDITNPSMTSILLYKNIRSVKYMNGDKILSTMRYPAN